MTWIVVHTKNNNEFKASKNLVRQGFEVFYPKVLKSNINYNRVRKIIKPLFPGYIFVNLKKNQNWIKINSTFGVRTILKFGRNIYLLPIQIISQIKMKCDKNDICHISDYKKGDKVKINFRNSPSLQSVFDEKLDQKRCYVFLELLKTKFKIKVFNNTIEAIE